MGKKESAGKSSGGIRWDHTIPSARRARAYKTTRLSSQSDAARTSFRCAGPDLPARRIRPRKPTLCALLPSLPPFPFLVPPSSCITFGTLTSNKLNLIFFPDLSSSFYIIALYMFSCPFSFFLFFYLRIYRTYSFC